MPKIDSQVKTWQYMCDNCHVGEMIYTHRDQETYPPKHEHECNNCHFIEYFNEVFPRVELNA